MSLYLCVFDGDEELDGVDVGSYADFDAFRDCVVRELESSNPGSKFPLLILHSDCDGQWSPEEAKNLGVELAAIGDELHQRLPVAVTSDWQKLVVKSQGLHINSLYDCFFDVDGESLIERMIGLTKLSQQRNLPILFQ